MFVLHCKCDFDRSIGLNCGLPGSLEFCVYEFSDVHFCKQGSLRYLSGFQQSRREWAPPTVQEIRARRAAARGNPVTPITILLRAVPSTLRRSRPEGCEPKTTCAYTRARAQVLVNHRPCPCGRNPRAFLLRPVIPERFRERSTERNPGPNTPAA